MSARRVKNKKKTKKSPNKNMVFQYYLVVFLDHLGQSNKLRSIKSLPHDNIEREVFINQLKQTFGQISTVRIMFNDFFNSYLRAGTNINKIPPESRKEYRDSQRNDISYYGISDSIIITVPLANSNEHCTPLNGVFCALVAICDVHLLLLSEKRVIRAGLDVGIAAQIDAKEIYGPALESAYFLESNLAEYPRLLVGSELIDYIYSIENQKCTTRLGHIAKLMAGLCRKMIIQDTDGRYMLDFLGPTLKDQSDKAIDYSTIIKARDFVKAQHLKYLKENNEKMSSRYYRLLSYFESRKSIWQ